jgi:uncharacterized membrane protein
MLDGLRPFVSRIVGAVIGALAGALSTKVGIQVDPSTQASITTAVVVGAYGVVHKIVDKKLNPADTASTRLAAQGKEEIARASAM